MADLQISEIYKIVDQLEEYSNVFSMFYSNIEILMDDRIPTAGVKFSEVGSPVVIVINPKFWESISLEEKKFVLVHEALHIIFLHGYRSLSNVLGVYSTQVLNIAMDIAINEYIARSFNINLTGFDSKQYCFVETVFGKGSTISRKETFETYLALLRNSSCWRSKGLVDNHDNIIDYIRESKHGNIASSIDSIVKEAIGSDDKIQQDLEKAGLKFGTEQSNSFKTIIAKQFKNNPIWNSLLRESRRKNIKSSTEDIDYTESWIKENRRSSTLDGALLLPREVEDLTNVPKVKLVIYLDVSGSCTQYCEPFIELMNSIPSRKFEIEAYAFDTRISYINHKERKIKIKMGGGTDFNCIVRHNNDLLYKPDITIIVTDGEAQFSQNPVVHAKSWNWFMTRQHTMDYINRHPAFRDFKKQLVLDI